MHHSSSSSSMTAEQTTRGVAVEKLETMKKWGLNTYKVHESLPDSFFPSLHSDTVVVFLMSLSAFLVVSVHKADDLGAFWPRLSDRGPGAGGSDRGVERHEEEIRECVAIG